MKKLERYINSACEALMVSLSNSNIYKGKEGCLRLAREFGFCLNDFDKKDIKEALTSSYSLIVVKGYNLNPPIDAKEWVSEVKSKLEVSYGIK